MNALDAAKLQLLLDANEEDMCDTEVQETRDFNKKIEKALISIELELRKHGEMTWNKIPMNIRGLPTLYQYKKQLKSYLTS